MSFADLRKQKARDQFHSSGINITYTEQEKEDVPKKSTGSLLASRRDSQQSQRLPQPETSVSPATSSEQHQTSPGPGKTCTSSFSSDPSHCTTINLLAKKIDPALTPLKLTHFGGVDLNSKMNFAICH